VYVCSVVEFFVLIVFGSISCQLRHWQLFLNGLFSGCWYL